MAVDAYLILGGRPGPSESKQDTIDTLSFGNPNNSAVIQPATVQVGENNLGQVAARLGLHAKDLLAANPHIKDPANLKVGQEIHLPKHPEPPSESSSESSHTLSHVKELPNAPMGVSVESTVMRGKLDVLAEKEYRKKD